jgi:hypothetical protein
MDISRRIADQTRRQGDHLILSDRIVGADLCPLIGASPRYVGRYQMRPRHPVLISSIMERRGQIA